MVGLDSDNSKANISLPRSPVGRGNYERGRATHCDGGNSAVSCAKMAESVEMLFRIGTRMGLRKRVLGGGAHWRHLLNSIKPSMCGGNVAFLWPPYVIGQAIIFLPCGFYLLLFSIFFPRLISAATDWMSTILLHMAWP